jgi:flagellar basal-body rod modification protein FlgD
MTTSTTGATATTASTAASTIASGQSSLTTDYDSFLKLLTTQLQNQDPLSPMDSNTFTQQLVAMNGVQQQLLTNNLLTTLVGQGSSAANAVNLIGKTVQAQSASATLSNGSATWNYQLASTAASATLQVLDSTNNVVYSQAAPNLSTASTPFTWDGTTSSGGKATSGTYTLKVIANDSNLATVSSTVSVGGVVTGVQQVNGATQLNIGATTVPYADVSSVTNPGN